MPVNFFPARFEVLRNPDKCIKCRACERQCSNEVHYYDSDYDKMLANEAQCVDCQRCVCICPTGALKIRKNENSFNESVNYTQIHCYRCYQVYLHFDVISWHYHLCSFW